MLEKDLLQFQIGKETTWGTVVAPTAKLMLIDPSSGGIKPMVRTKQFADLRGSLAPSHESALDSQSASASLQGVVTYDDIGYWLEGICGVATPTGSDPYTYTGEAPGTTKPSVRLFSLVHGNGSDVYGLTGGVVNQLVIQASSGESDNDVTFSTELIGKSVATDTLEALSDRTVNPVMGNQMALYIDAWGGTIGTTEFTDVRYSFELTLNANRMLVHTLGALAPANYAQKKFEAANTLKLSLEFGTTSQAFLDDIVGASSVFQKQVRLKFTSGTDILQLDFAGTQTESPDIFTDNDGVTTVDLELKAEYNSGLANWFAYSNTNGVSALP